MKLLQLVQFWFGQLYFAQMSTIYANLQDTFQFAQMVLIVRKFEWSSFYYQIWFRLLEFAQMFSKCQF